MKMKIGILEKIIKCSNKDSFISSALITNRFKLKFRSPDI